MCECWSWHCARCYRMSSFRLRRPSWGATTDVGEVSIRAKGSTMTCMDSTIDTRYWHELEDGRVQCDVCPRACKLHDGQRGLCFVRGAEGGRVKLFSYGRSSGFCVDPIEKKPLNHFLPGSSVLSFGTAGCNLACKFCFTPDTLVATSSGMRPIAELFAACEE